MDIDLLRRRRLLQVEAVDVRGSDGGDALEGFGPQGHVDVLQARRVEVPRGDQDDLDASGGGVPQVVDDG